MARWVAPPRANAMGVSGIRSGSQPGAPRQKGEPAQPRGNYMSHTKTVKQGFASLAGTTIGASPVYRGDWRAKTEDMVGLAGLEPVPGG